MDIIKLDYFDWFDLGDHQWGAAFVEMESWALVPPCLALVERVDHDEDLGYPWN